MRGFYKISFFCEYVFFFVLKADSNLNDLICEYQQHQEITTSNAYEEEEMEEFQEDQE